MVTERYMFLAMELECRSLKEKRSYIKMLLEGTSKNVIRKEIKFLEEWLEKYSEGEDMMLVSEREISNRIKELKDSVNMGENDG